MAEAQRDSLGLHQDPEFFREAVIFTAARTGFTPRLVEKDYYCSVVLRRLVELSGELVFRGGICLAKIHTEFYRLSEDLDFLIPTPVAARRSERSRRAAHLKAVLADGDVLPAGLRLASSLAGANQSTHYAGAVEYDSLLSTQPGLIKVEIGLREPTMTAPAMGAARTLLVDPIRDRPLAPTFPVPCLSLEEAMAEKLRAALSRREPAIRDYYDVDHAVRHMGFPILQPSAIELVKIKLSVPGNDPPDTSPERFAALRRQLTARLQPVLRGPDFEQFDLQRAWETVAEVAVALG